MKGILEAAAAFVFCLAPILIGLAYGKRLFNLSPADRAELEQRLYAGSFTHPDNLPKKPEDRIG